MPCGIAGAEKCRYGICQRDDDDKADNSCSFFMNNRRQKCYAEDIYRICENAHKSQQPFSFAKAFEYGRRKNIEQAGKARDEGKYTDADDIYPIEQQKARIKNAARELRGNTCEYPACQYAESAARMFFAGRKYLF